MKTRPIIFSCPMVKAILEGTKTQTRRIVNPQPPADFLFAGRAINCADKTKNGITEWVDNLPLVKKSHHVRCPFEGVKQLWVRETFQTTPSGIPFYKADFDGIDMSNVTIMGGWKSPLFMQRNRSRITLEITSVKVERLQDISDYDAEKEGIEPDPLCPSSHYLCADGTPTRCPRAAFEILWTSIHGPESWEQNPWVWRIEFRRIKP